MAEQVALWVVKQSHYSENGRWPADIYRSAGDPIVPGRHHKISLPEAFKHLVHYANKVDGNFVCRFATYRRFPYWALNMKQRHQLISQSSVYLQQHPSDAKLTVENHRDMIGHLSAEQLMLPGYKVQVSTGMSATKNFELSSNKRALQPSSGQ